MDEQSKKLLERAATLVGNPATNISSSTDIACQQWHDDYERWKKQSEHQSNCNLPQVSRWAYIYENWSAIALGMLIATVFYVLVNMFENIVVKIALIFNAS